MAPTSSFDFEESLSALSVTSVVNQGRSYPPIRHHTSPATSSQASHMVISRPPPSNPHRHHTAPQKSRSSSSLSSSSHHTDATRRTNGSYGTSTSESSVSPAAEVSPPLLSRIDMATFHYLSPGSLYPALVVRTVELGDYRPGAVSSTDGPCCPAKALLFVSVSLLFPLT